jgi:hypothetical protein
MFIVLFFDNKIYIFENLTLYFVAMPFIFIKRIKKPTTNIVGKGEKITMLLDKAKTR